jgi:hypothetical protein
MSTTPVRASASGLRASDDNSCVVAADRIHDNGITIVQSRQVPVAMTDTPAGVYQRLLNADVTRAELAWAFINLSGRHPNELGSLDAILPADVRCLVDDRVESAPRDEEAWGALVMIWSEFDPDDLKRAFRAGVEAIRAFREMRGDD